MAEGEALFGPAIAGRLTAFFQRTRSKTPHDPTLDPFPELTDRERDVLELIEYGANNQEIAQRLHISAKTVSNHISNIFNKLQVVDRAGHCHRATSGAGRRIQTRAANHASTSANMTSRSGSLWTS
ncbi:MAG: LuxR C-terminal-related transcriptional regulator [Caldilineaceae bacterium]